MDHRLAASARPLRELVEEGRELVEEGIRPAQGAALAITEQARSAVDAAADSIRSAVEPIGFQPMSAETLARRLSRAADELRGASDTADTRAMEDAADRERLRAALIAGVVLTVLSAVVFIVAREIAKRDKPAPSERDPHGNEHGQPEEGEHAAEPVVIREAGEPVAGRL